MSILTDAFLATDTALAAARFEGMGGPAAFFPTLPGKGIDPVTLFLLETIVVEQTSPELDFAILDQRLVRGNDTSEEGIYQFPEPVVARLAALTSAEISLYGTIWASTEEMCGPKKTPHTASVIQYLQQLCQLARQGQAEQKHMYMRIAL